MEAGRAKNLQTKMKGTINQENKLTDIYLPRKCDYTDRLITSKDHSSILLSICDVFIHSFRSMMMELSTLESLTLSPFADSSDQLDRVTLPLKKSSRRRNLSDVIYHSIFNINQQKSCDQITLRRFTFDE
jgi:hypothetical protein